MGFCEKPCAQTPFSLGNICSREMCLIWLFLLKLSQFYLVLFILACACFGGALAFTDLYQDKHTPKCHFSKLSVFI
jgi:hypothetical protein